MPTRQKSPRTKRASAPALAKTGPLRPILTGAAGGLFATGIVSAALAGAKSLGWIGKTAAPKVLHRTLTRANAHDLTKSPGSTMWATRFAVGASLGIALEFARRSLVS